MKIRTVAAALCLVTGAILGSAGTAFADGHDQPHHEGSTAHGVAKGSPGVLSGNVIQVPIQIPVNVCGNSINLVGILNPALGNTCVNA